MSTVIQPADESEIFYPESDGKPMADNTRQFRYIVMIEGGIEVLFGNNPNVFVAGDLLWYPVERHPEISAAPDTMVAFGRPKGDRGSYLQWREGNIPPQVVFEVMSPNNRPPEMMKKLAFYERHGVEEYYVYDPDDGSLTGYRRVAGRLQGISKMLGWISPRLGVRFEMTGTDLQLFRPDGQRFRMYHEICEDEAQAAQLAERAEKAAAKAMKDAAQARKDKTLANRQAEQAQQQAAAALSRAERLAAQLRALGIQPEVDQP